MSSLTTQESSNTQPPNPANPGSSQKDTSKGDPSVPFKTGVSTTPSGLSNSVDKTSYGQQNTCGTSEQRRGEDITQNTRQEYEGTGSLGMKTGSESLIDSVERSVRGGDGEGGGRV
ncbi:hypothetical protein A1F94_012868 [Pyrenophora tritici-repentis]|uniref:Uncharacterized protein n=2 Tax=Pyrenophora tritici-repentis TaxID=45151 RepID=A0A922N8W6_9PLEO|nr:uncharacterized protein PTRG_11049 [Pyrenophora tritici-repentis Pt-1C-BFP]KAG9376321.1 hypothetical protein A1F94_012868 [Pyrenophora tritici-repentis]EDU44099.1 predicted protein [Pyrenophora tritici-repentis Pt-1C-BFP]KAI1511817.1 hypothetical protein Ptr86124_009461 [Pyrenophora tritici-repentis]KAI1544898.1 hypothetical protein PtrSN001C_003379 [Pyrenophora tritici-repentis]KAI1582632.1 hypothetical protein PtrEW7m1_003788 [Pyrenophora tritici-repentis]